MSSSVLSRRAQWLVIALAFTVPQQVAVNNLVLAVLLLVALPVFGTALPALIRSNPVARSSFALFGVLFFGTLWGTTPWGEAMGILGKYADLAVIPLLMQLLRDPVTRERSLRAFFIIMIFALVLSWAIGLHLVPITPSLRYLIGPSALVDNPSIFHSHITQGVLTSYVGFLFALRARLATTSRQRLGFLLLTLLAWSNVLLMLQGRTGYLVLLALLSWLGWTVLRDKLQQQGRALGWKSIVAAMLLPIVLLAVSYQAVPRFHDRVATAVTEVQTWQPGADHSLSSMGTRFDFYANALKLIEQRPWAGYGTGGVAAAYKQQAAGTDVTITANLHNEYLMLAVQVGLPGTLLLLLLFFTQWRCANRLPPFERVAAQGLVVAYGLTCLLNSMLLDHTEGLFFAFFTAWLFARLDEQTPAA